MADLRPGLFNRMATQRGAPGLDPRVMQGGLVRAGDPQGDPMALARALMAMNEQGHGAPQQSVTVPASMPPAPMPSRQGGYGDATTPLPSPTAATQPQTLPGIVPAPPQAATAIPAQGGDQPTVKADVLAAVQQMLAQQLLPEHWRGSFSTPPGIPR